jgi:hypothetical protein
MTEQENPEWQPPPPPEQIPPADQPQMSEAATLLNVFIEPSNTFEDLKRKPRFIIASLIIAALITAFGFGLYYKVGDDGMRRFIDEQFDKNPQTQSLSKDDRASAMQLQLTMMTVARFAMPILVLISLAIGGLLYWAAAKAFGGEGGFLHGLSVWVYSSLPPVVVTMLASFVVLALKSVDDIDIAASQRGVLQANPSLLIDGKSMPVVATLLATLDVFQIWGWILAAIGLRITNKLSSGSAWAIVIIFALIGVAMRVVGSIFSGNPN